MANPAGGIALGAAAASFRSADERSIQREAIQSRERIATENRTSRENIAAGILEAGEEKAIVERGQGAFLGFVTDRQGQCCFGRAGRGRFYLRCYRRHFWRFGRCV